MRSGAVFIDLGKTLCYPGMQSALRDPGALHDIEELLAQAGFPRPRWQLLRAFLRIYGRYARVVKQTRREQRADDLIGDVLAALGIPSGDLPELARSIIGAYSNRIAVQSRLYPGARESLGVLRDRGYRLAIISDGVYDREYTVLLLQSLGILDFFDSITLSSEVGWRKPCPAIFETACRTMGVLPEQSTMIGDKVENDIKGAHRLGMRTVLFSPEGRFLFRVPADCLVRHWMQVPETIDRLYRNRPDNPPPQLS